MPAALQMMTRSPDRSHPTGDGAAAAGMVRAVAPFKNAITNTHTRPIHRRGDRPRCDGGMMFRMTLIGILIKRDDGGFAIECQAHSDAAFTCFFSGN